jgi:glycosyltransferase involved in cell wall biosynthesis
MKILSLIDAISGGGAMVMYNIIKGLPQHQHQIVVPAAWDTRQIGLPQMIAEAQIPVHYINAVREGCVAKALEEYVLWFDPDIIINHWWRSARIQRLNKFGRTRKVYGRAKIVLVSHNNDPSPPGYDYYVSVSKHNAQFQKYITKERSGGAPNHRVIYNGIDVKKFDVPKQPIKDKFVIGRISALPKFKIPQDWISFAKSFDIPNALHMIVGEGERRGHLLRDIRLQGMQDKFDLPGEVPNQEIPNTLAKFDIVCYITEKTEAFSLAIIEAMAAGLPVVAQNVGGTPEQIIHGVNGFLCTSRREVKYYCEELARNHKLRHDMGVAAKERAQQFTIKHMCEEYDKLFKELVNGQG